MEESERNNKDVPVNGVTDVLDGYSGTKDDPVVKVWGLARLFRVHSKTGIYIMQNTMVREVGGNYQLGNKNKN